MSAAFSGRSEAVKVATSHPLPQPGGVTEQSRRDPGRLSVRRAEHAGVGGCNLR